ncbi:protein cornichon homolog 3 isoform X5 [Physeter macrocephalus]|uniref:Protein cornichon homolog 3 isoform X5 n=1 Tax=Physeter macrocephalus TaxID=9755 RepID=A0A9W2WM27_PHYMC|nr:protein cornichon homolog 3 isoform X5 [Physeter catodon]
MFLPEFRQAQLFVPASEAAWLQVLMCVQIFLEPLPWNCPPQEYEVWGAGSGSRWSQEDGSGSRQFQTSPRAPSCPLQAVFTPPTPVLSLGSDLRSPSLSSRPPPALAEERSREDMVRGRSSASQRESSHQKLNFPVL